MSSAVAHNPLPTLAVNKLSSRSFLSVDAQSLLASPVSFKPLWQTLQSEVTVTSRLHAAFEARIKEEVETPLRNAPSEGEWGTLKIVSTYNLICRGNCRRGAESIAIALSTSHYLLHCYPHSRLYAQRDAELLPKLKDIEEMQGKAAKARCHVSCPNHPLLCHS